MAAIRAFKPKHAFENGVSNMAKRTTPPDIPIDELEKMIDEAQSTMEERIWRIRAIENQIRPKGVRYNRFANYVKIAIIVLGAIGATRAVADRLWPAPKDQAGSLLSVEIFFSVLSVAIVIISQLDTYFTPGDHASELNALKAKCEAKVDYVQLRWLMEVVRYGYSKEAWDNAMNLIAVLDEYLIATKMRLAEIRVHLEEVTPAPQETK
jgi:hypothetical protein